MRLLDVLIDEHRGFSEMLDVLDAIAARLGGRGEVPDGMAADVLDFFENFADRHHGKEEDVLFPMLAQHGLGPDQTVVAALLAQHEAGRAYSKKMRADLGRLRAGNRAARADLAMHARGYTELIREHIRIEDDYFYKLADSLLSSSEQVAVVQVFRGPHDLLPSESRQRYLEMIPRYRGVVAQWERPSL